MTIDNLTDFNKLSVIQQAYVTAIINGESPLDAILSAGSTDKNTGQILYQLKNNDKIVALLAEHADKLNKINTPSKQGYIDYALQLRNRAQTNGNDDLALRANRQAAEIDGELNKNMGKGDTTNIQINLVERLNAAKAIEIVDIVPAAAKQSAPSPLPPTPTTVTKRDTKPNK